MKRFVTLLLTLCFLVTWGLNSAAGAEGIHLEGSPWTNSNLYGNWPLELPGPEENFELYVNYDLYREISSMMEEERIGQISRTDQKVLDMMRGLCQDQGKAGSEEECLRILYSLYTEAEREEKSFAALMNCVDKLKAVGTLDELTNLISEEGFLYSPNVFYYEIMESMEGKYIMGVTIEQILDDLPVPDDAEYDGIPAKDAEGTKKKLLAMRYTEEEATRLTEQLLAYDSSWDRVYELTERESELDFKGDLSLNEIREICPQACEVMSAQGVVKEGREEEPMYQILPITSALGFRELYRQENLELIKAIIALKLYRLPALRILL